MPYIVCVSQRLSMKTARKIIVEIAVSADGYIARPDGDVEWLNRRPPVDYGIMQSIFSSPARLPGFLPTMLPSSRAAELKMLCIGRKTYDWALAYQKKSGMKKSPFDKNVANYV